MKRLKNIYKAVLIVAIYSIVVVGCGHDHSSHDHSSHDHNDDHSGHDHAANTDDHGDDAHDDGAKIVHLNQAQFENAEIDTGWYEMKNISDVVHANGYTKLDPQDEADVNVPLSGMIQSVKVIEGNYVKKGQTLATMQSIDFNQILLSKSSISEEQKHVRANIDFLKMDYSRQQKLSEESISAKKRFEEVSRDLKVEEMKLQSVQEQLNIVNQSIGQLATTDNGQILIKAPISGYITDMDIKIGSEATPGNPLFSIVDNSQMHVDLLVYEKDLGKVKVGQHVRFILTNQSNKEIKGEIYNIGKSFASDTKSVAVHADIEKNDASLISGMYINALIDVGNNTVPALPESAIVWAEGRYFIFVIDPAHKGELEFERIEVKTGAQQLGYTQITILEPIPDNHRIVTSGAYYLQSHLQKMQGGGGHSH